MSRCRTDHTSGITRAGGQPLWRELHADRRRRAVGVLSPVAMLVAFALSASTVSAQPVLEPTPLAPAPRATTRAPSPPPRATEDYLRDTEVHAYPVYQPPLAEDGLVQYEVSRQIATTPGAPCGACGCNCGGPCRRGCGCPHPWRTGPGWCDDWCVGPHWDVSIDGLLLRRENFDVAGLEGVFGGAASPVEQFHYEAGARAYATGRGIMGYDVQLGYVGVDVWRGYASFVPPGLAQQDIEYRTGFHSGELNIFPQAYAPWRLFAGVRYFELGEDFWVRDVAADVEDAMHVENKMIGFQVGLRRELWHFTEWAYVEALVNGGIYRNRIERLSASGTVTGGSIVDSQVEYNDIAFLGEASLTAVARLNQCLALRGGYQVLFVDGVTTAQDAFLFPSNQTGSLVYHGAHVGLEYRR